MRGSPSAPLVAVGDRLNDWTPRLFPHRGEFEQEIMALYQAEYMVGGTSRLPSKVIENQDASLGRLARKDRFPAMVRISERTAEIRTHANGGSGRVGVKGQDVRPSTAPLTPTRPQREPARSFRLTEEDAVIHGVPRFVRGKRRKTGAGPSPYLMMITFMLQGVRVNDSGKLWAPRVFVVGGAHVSVVAGFDWS